MIEEPIAKFWHLVLVRCSHYRLLVFCNMLVVPNLVCRCNKSSSPFSRLDEHLVSAHRYTAGQHRCEACPRSFSFRPGLIRHRTSAHPDLRRYSCENCPKVSTVFFLIQGKDSIFTIHEKFIRRKIERYKQIYLNFSALYPQNS